MYLTGNPSQARIVLDDLQSGTLQDLAHAEHSARVG